ncbi:MAG: transglutaminase domain-containing protein [Bacteroidota bacterium]
MIKSLLIIVLFSSTLVFTQQRDSVYEAAKHNAWNAYQTKDYSRAISLYKKALTFPDAREYPWQYYYTISECYALAGDADNAFEQLEKSIMNGNTDSHLIDKDPDLLSLKKQYPARFSAVLTKADEAFHTARINESPIAITLFDNYVGPSNPTNYLWDGFHHPKMDSLRRKYALAGIIKNGTNEFQKMKLMLHWVSNRFEHSSNNPCKGSDALSILADAEKGAQLRCVEYGRLFANCMDALGYPARTVGLTKFGTGFGTPLGHVGAEVWSNQFQKWIFFDGQNDAWWEAGGIPLSADECRQHYIHGDDSGIVFVGQNKGYDYGKIKSDWFPYFYHVDLSNNFAFFDSSIIRNKRYFEFTTDETIPELFSQGMPQNISLSSDREFLYPRLNQTTIHLLHTNLSSPSDTLNVIMTHSMSWFDKFMVRINGGEWKISEDQFQWLLAKGENTIEAKAVNTAGIEGRISRIQLRNNIAAKL